MPRNIEWVQADIDWINNKLLELDPMNDEDQYLDLQLRLQKFEYERWLSKQEFEL